MGAIGLLFVAMLAVYLEIGTVLLRPSQHTVAPPPPGLEAARVEIPSPSGATLVAWLITPPSPRGAAVVLHGVRADRATMLRRARLLRQEGFAVLVPDLQAHGESPGEQVTFGHLEAKDAQAQTRALFAAVQAPKELWLVRGAGHIDLLRYDPDGYRQHVVDFLTRHVPRAPRLSAGAVDGLF
jgi:alpha-beta hydrolase superfamily lysophospholipase